MIEFVASPVTYPHEAIVKMHAKQGGRDRSIGSKSLLNDLLHNGFRSRTGRAVEANPQISQRKRENEEKHKDYVLHLAPH